MNKILAPKGAPYPPFIKGGKPPREEKIFVQIASYRDPECQWTVKDMFEKAKYPDRVFAGICWQFDSEEDKDCFQIPSPRPDQVRMVPVDWREADGVCWARNMTQSLWEQEEYTLQIDAHMRFVRDWDALLIQEFALCESPKPVLSCSPASYTPPGKLQKNLQPTIRRARPFDAYGNLRFKGEMLDRAPERPLRGAFISAGFVFARSEVIHEVPYDPYLYFDQEEIVYAARLFTHGWDVFSARGQFLYHYYNDPAGSVRPLHWRDARAHDGKRIEFLRQRAAKRFDHLTGHRVCNEPDVIMEIDRYGFGTARTLAQFEELTGIDFKKKQVSEKGLKALFITGLSQYRSRPIADDPPAPREEKKKEEPPVKPAAADEAAPPARILADALARPGDVMPFFVVPDHAGSLRALELYAGREVAMFFTRPGDEAALAALFEAVKAEERSLKKKPWFLFVLPAAPERLSEIKRKHAFPHALWADPDGALCRALGLGGAGGIPMTGMALDRNLRVLSIHAGISPADLARSVAADCAGAQHREPSQIVRFQAPVLMVPGAFSQEFCARCIAAFEGGEFFEGTVGAEEKTAYRPQAKARLDFIVSGALLEEIDAQLSRTLFPEIKKVFGFEVTHREMYKIGRYDAEKSGFFRQHRDNFETPLGYRRIAMTLHLNDEYEGGGIRFPEYTPHVYRPETGGAVAFSCGLMHEAMEVKKGRRYIVVGFFHGAEEEAFRRHYLMGKESPVKAAEYALKARREYPGVPQSRTFYADWQASHVHYGQEAAAARSVCAFPPAQVALRHPAIFVQIPSYRDTECQWTVNDLFDKAEHPEHIFVGICWQCDPDFDRDCFHVMTRPDQVRMMLIHWKDSQGACWARNQAQQLWQGEDFVLQIDSHSRFVPGWDARLIELLKKCPSDRPVLSTFPQGYSPPDRIRRGDPLKPVARAFDNQGIVGLGSKSLAAEERGREPLPGAFIASNFIFSPATAICEVPCDPHLYFCGGDISYSARLWTAGWDFFVPTDHILYHDWNRKSRHTHWEDHHDWSKLAQSATRRIRHLLQIDASTPPGDLVDIDHYGLGTARPLSGYAVFAGLDFKARVINARAVKGDFSLLVANEAVSVASVVSATTNPPAPPSPA